jgi:hypothetical protein
MVSMPFDRPVEAGFGGWFYDRDRNVFFTVMDSKHKPPPDIDGNAGRSER